MSIATICTCGMSLNGYCNSRVKECTQLITAPALHPSKSAGVKDITYDAELNFEDIPEPIGSFILAQKDIDCTQTANGAYWHYSAVCALLGRYAQEKAAGASAVWVKASDRLPDHKHDVPLKLDGQKYSIGRKVLELLYVDLWGGYIESEEQKQRVQWLDESATEAEYLEYIKQKEG